ncbi:MAG: ABC transporter ATP-binding protein [Armatimonadota bacterium]|nr:ABC transporter ATP-binding protein [Armatimonadota bacterium]
MPEQRPAVETRGLRKTYFGAVPVKVLHGIDMLVMPGEFVSVLGQSGSGKSTLLNCLGALDRPTEGRVVIDGQDLADLDDDELADFRNSAVGFIFQFHYLQDEFTCLENALMPVSIRRGTPDDQDVERVIDLLQRVGLDHRLGNLPSQLSGGEQQRTAIVRALANQPRLVLADEPTGNLDSVSSDQVFTLMREINQETGVAFVMVTHDDRLASQGDRILRIQDGLLTED